jgi:hypothetical protein
MTTVSASTTFTIVAATAYPEQIDLVLLPENAGGNVRRELHYPDDVFPPLVYPQNPDSWTGFDTEPIKAPTLVSEKTLGGNKLARWGGYIGDNAVIETWKGDAKTLSMTADFLRRLLEFYLNPPLIGYVTWYPKDRTNTPYNIEIESLTVNGATAVNLDYLATRGGYVVGDVALAFRIVGEVA